MSSISKEPGTARYVRIEVAESSCIELAEIRVYTLGGIKIEGLEARFDCESGVGSCVLASQCVDGNENTTCSSCDAAGEGLEIDIGGSCHVTTSLFLLIVIFSAF